MTWNELWEFAGYLYPEAKNTLREIQTAPLLQDVPFPYPPTISVAKQGLFYYFQMINSICNLLNSQNQLHFELNSLKKNFTVICFFSAKNLEEF